MYWRLADYLDVLSGAVRPQLRLFHLREIVPCGAVRVDGPQPVARQSFRALQPQEFNAIMNYNARYTDIMLFTTPDLPAADAV